MTTNGPDQQEREFTRVEAAVFLTELGRKMSQQRLATRASEGLPPEFEKQGTKTIYRESVLRDFAVKSENKGGRGKRTNKIEHAAGKLQSLER